MAIFLTGDTHQSADISKLNSKHLRQNNITITERDYLIILGDAGFLWNKNAASDKYWQNWIKEKPWTTLVIPGNHENYDWLLEYPIIEHLGIRVRKINSKLFYIERGEILQLEGKTFFCMGGATSHDKENRKEGLSWWSQEIPSYQEFEYALDNLEKVNYQVDYILSHCTNSKTVYQMGFRDEDILTNFFLHLERDWKLEFIHNYFGHYHQDKQIDEKHTCLFNNIIKI